MASPAWKTTTRSRIDRPAPPPAFLDDPALSVTLADVRASLEFEAATRAREKPKEPRK